MHESPSLRRAMRVRTDRSRPGAFLYHEPVSPDPHIFCAGPGITELEWTVYPMRTCRIAPLRNSGPRRYHEISVENVREAPPACQGSLSYRFHEAPAGTGREETRKSRAGGRRELDSLCGPGHIVRPLWCSSIHEFCACSLNPDKGKEKKKPHAELLKMDERSAEAGPHLQLEQSALHHTMMTVTAYTIRTCHPLPIALAARVLPANTSFVTQKTAPFHIDFWSGESQFAD